MTCLVVCFQIIAAETKMDQFLSVLLKCQASVAMKTHHPMMWCSVHFKSTIIWSNTLRSTVVDVYITYA